MNAAEAIKPLQWLVGRWSSISAKGIYPTIKSFEYCEELEFKFCGQPMLNYTSRTWLPENNKPMHMESGFLRINPDTNQVAFMIAHNFGITTLEEGEVCNNSLTIKTTDITRMSFANEPAVCGLERFYKLNGSRLELLVNMSTSRTPMTEHLRVIYKKKEC